MQLLRQIKINFLKISLIFLFTFFQLYSQSITEIQKITQINGSTSDNASNFGIVLDVNHEGDMLIIGEVNPTNNGHLVLYKNLNGNTYSFIDSSKNFTAFDGGVSDSKYSVAFDSIGNIFYVASAFRNSNQGIVDIRLASNSINGHIGTVYNSLGEIQGKTGFGYNIASSSNGRILAIHGKSWPHNNTSLGGISILDHTNGFDIINGTSHWPYLDIGINDFNGANDIVSIDINNKGDRIVIGTIDMVDGQEGMIYTMGKVSSTKYQHYAAPLSSGSCCGDRFSYSVGLNGNGTILAVGAVNGDNPNNVKSAQGYVRIYQLRKESVGNEGGIQYEHYWRQIGETIYGKVAEERFGYSVSLDHSGTKIAIGTDNYNTSTDSPGKVRIYEYDGLSWDQIGSDIVGDANDDGFGKVLKINGKGDKVFVGAPSLEGYVKVFAVGYNTYNKHLVTKGNDGDFNTIQAAINAASSGDTIEVEAGNIWYENLVIENKNIYLRGKNDAIVTLDGGGLTHGIRINGSNITRSKMIIENFIIRNSDSENNPGGGLKLENIPVGGGITLKNVRFDSNKGGNGGGFYSNGGKSYLENCYFLSNTAGTGGAIYLDNDYGTEIFGGFINSNLATIDSDRTTGGIQINNIMSNSNVKIQNIYIGGNSGIQINHTNQASNIEKDTLSLSDMYLLNSGSLNTISTYNTGFLQINAVHFSGTSSIDNRSLFLDTKNINIQNSYFYDINHDLNSQGHVLYNKKETAQITFSNCLFMKNPNSVNPIDFQSTGKIFLLEGGIGTTLLIQNSVLTVNGFQTSEDYFYVQSGGEIILKNSLINVSIPSSYNRENNIIQKSPLFCGISWDEIFYPAQDRFEINENLTVFKPTMNVKVAANSPLIGAASDGSNIAGAISNCQEIQLDTKIFISSSNGQDTQQGTIESPMATFDAAYKKASDGDTIILMPGTYTEQFLYYSGKNVSLASLFLINEIRDNIHNTIIEVNSSNTFQEPTDSQITNNQEDASYDISIIGLTFMLNDEFSGIDFINSKINIDNCYLVV